MRVNCVRPVNPSGTGNNPLTGPPPPRCGHLIRMLQLDREAEAGCSRSHDGVCTVRGKVTLIIHEQSCKLVSSTYGKSYCGGSQWSSICSLVSGGKLNWPEIGLAGEVNLNFQSCISHCSLSLCFTCGPLKFLCWSHFVWQLWWQYLKQLSETELVLVCESEAYWFCFK